MGQFSFAASLVIVVFGLILAIAWIILPFALIGTKPLLRELIQEQRRTNTLLAQRDIPSIEPGSREAPKSHRSEPFVG